MVEVAEVCEEGGGGGGGGGGTGVMDSISPFWSHSDVAGASPAMKYSLSKEEKKKRNQIFSRGNCSEAATLHHSSAAICI